jgi:hypothetical protein
MRPAAEKLAMRNFPHAILRTSCLAIATALALAAGCGGIETDLHNPDPAQCLGGMEEFARFDGYVAGNNLVWHDGTLYLNGETSDPTLLGTNAVSDQGGPMSVVADGYYWMQADGDNLLLATADRFYAMPFSGSQPQLLADGGTEEVNGNFNGDVFVTAADSDFFYWILDALDNSHTVWAKPRAGGPSVNLGNPDPPNGFGVEASLTPAGEQVILASTNGRAWAIDKTSLQWRTLASPPSTYQFHTFVDPAGALWSSYDGGVGVAEHYTMWKSSLDGGPLQPFWQSKPSRLAPFTMFPDGAGGWVVNALEWFSDRQIHSSVWTLDSIQHGQRRACLPALATASVSAVAYSPQFIYLEVFVWPDDHNFYTSLYRLARQ